MVDRGRTAGPSGSLHRLPVSSNGTKGNRGRASKSRCSWGDSDGGDRRERKESSIGFVWAPAHAGIEGNEVADTAAKRSLNRAEVDVKVPLGKMVCRSIVNERLHCQWQQEWERESTGTGQKLFQIQTSVRRGRG